jgi:hypothetical protein
VISLELDKTLNYKNILTLNSKIVALFFYQNESHFLLRVYDDELNILEERIFKGNSSRTNETTLPDISLCSLSENEIICWDGVEKKCKIYDFELKFVKEFGQCMNQNEPFFFCNGILFKASSELLLFYYYDLSNDEPIHYIKIIDRTTGFLKGVINLTFECFSRLLFIDTESNILLRSHNPNNLIKYYDSQGNLIGMFSNAEFSKFNHLDLTKNDELICFDKTDNKIFFL